MMLEISATSAFNHTMRKISSQEVGYKRKLSLNKIEFKRLNKM